MKNSLPRPFRQPLGTGRSFLDQILFLIPATFLAASLLWGCQTGFVTDPCTQDSQCTFSQICIDGWCKDGCKVTSDCAFPKVCQNNGGTPEGDCVHKTCEEDNECRYGSWCKSRRCKARTCAFDPNSCLEDQFCSNETCYPDSCDEESDCTASETSCVVRETGAVPDGRCVDNP